MQAKRDWERIIRRMELLLRLKSFPVGFKMLEKKEELGTIPFMRRLGHKATLCQMINLVRNFDWTVGADVGDFLSPVCASIIGLQEIPAIYKDGTFRSIVWVKTKEDARRYEASIPRLPMGKYEAVAMAPLVYNPFEPDIVLIYANPAQMILLINALQFEDYQVMQFFCVGESSCSDAIARSFLTGKPCVTIPCYGERRYGHAQDDELVMGIPSFLMEKTLKGLEVLYRRGVRYPISYAGAEQDVSGAFPMAYSGIQELEALRGKDNRLLLGVTGGIASGKTTVANMLAELGAKVVDFDLIARKLVEPGQPALKEIVDYFGTQVLKQDGTLDRKKLSQIVFQDMEKRKKLESFIHPRIGKEVLRQVNIFAEQDPNAIIQLVVPLMIEQNLQYQCHKLLVVYVPEEIQIQRLMERDKITRDQAQAMLKAQLPIEEKLGYADFVIRNDGSLEETRRQVKELWEKLKAVQEKRISAQGESAN